MEDLEVIEYHRMFRIQRSDAGWNVVTSILGILVDPLTLRAAKSHSSKAYGLTQGAAQQLCCELERWYGSQPTVTKDMERKAKH